METREKVGRGFPSETFAAELPIRLIQEPGWKYKLTHSVSGSSRVQTSIQDHQSSSDFAGYPFALQDKHRQHALFPRPPDRYRLGCCGRSASGQRDLCPRLYRGEQR